MAIPLLQTKLYIPPVRPELVSRPRLNHGLNRCIVLADDVHQQQEAEAAGADVVLLKGYPAARLIATIDGLLSREEKGGVYAD